MARGTVGRLGVSNIYDPDELAWLIAEAKVPVSVVQNRWYEGNGWDWPSTSGALEMVETNHSL